MTGCSPGRAQSAEMDALHIAMEACASSGEHGAGKGRHDAHKWGPCSDHERITREVLGVLYPPAQAPSGGDA